MKRIASILVVILISSIYIRACQNTDNAPAPSTEQPVRQDSLKVTTVLHTGSVSNNGLYKQSRDWTRYKVLRAFGWTSLGIGVPTTLFGLYVTCMQTLDGGDSSLGVTALITGGVLTISSIPLLITANHYKRKAKRLEMSLSAMEMPKYIDKSGYVPALKFSISF